MNDMALRDTVCVNGEDELLNAATLSELLAEKGIALEGRGTAVAINGSVVPRADWTITLLRPGDSVEIVTARQGG